MSTDYTNPKKLGFSSQCIPGSLAEEKETERLAEFHREKVRKQAEEALTKPERDAKEQLAYQAACEAHRNLMNKRRPASS